MKRIISILLLVLLLCSCSNSSDNKDSSTYSSETSSYITAYYSISSETDTSATVYITEYGEKYHRSSCQYLSKSKIKTTVKKAIASGYEPCKRCHPPKQ